LKILIDFLRILWYKGESMAYPYTSKLVFPLEDWKVNYCKFRQRDEYDGKLWGLHLGEDCIIKPGTPVKAIGRGKVVYSKLHATKKSPKQGGYRNWGNIIIIAHKNPKTKKVFFSLYGHLGNRLVEKGDRVDIGQKIGTVGRAWSQQNGWWEDAHLHFAIYTGPWEGRVLPGYWKSTQKRTKLRYWAAPTKFIKNYRV